MFTEYKTSQEQRSGRAPGRVLPVMVVLALGAICGIAGAMLFSHRPSPPTITSVPKPQAAAAASPVDTTPVLRQVSAQQVQGRMQVAFALDQMVPYDAHRLSNPYRIYVDLHELHIAHDLSHTIQVNTFGVQRIRIAQTLPDTVRAVLDLDSSFRYEISPQSNPAQLLMWLIPASTAQAKLKNTKSANQ